MYTRSVAVLARVSLVVCMLGCGRIGFDDGAMADAAVDAGSSASCVGSGLVAHWRLDEFAGTPVADSVGGHDGILQNPSAASWLPAVASSRVR